jgi:histidinol-phosphate aminotransferase
VRLPNSEEVYRKAAPGHNVWRVIIASMSSEQRHHWIKPGVRGLRAAERFRVDPQQHRLHWNENPYEFPADLKEIVLARLAEAGWAHYPLGLRPWSLIERIAAHNGVAADRVVAAPGSSDLIKLLMSSVLHPGDNVVLPCPTFLLYRPGIRMMQANSIEVPLRAEDDFSLPVDALIEAAQVNDARLVVICAPNNPTGTVYPVASLLELAAAVPSLLLVDAAYLEFTDLDYAPLLAHENVVVLRTFSKLYAMAGVRVGYALTTPYLAGELQKVVSDFPLSVFAELAADVALEHSGRFDAIRTQLLHERERLAAALNAISGVHVFPSGTNFLLVQTERPRQALLDYLLHEHNLLVSDLAAYPELHDCVRISIGTPQQNDLVAQAFRQYFVP